jgi:NAD+ synthase
MIDRSSVVAAMKVLPKIDPEFEIKRRVDFIKKTLINSGLKHLILGVSGGIDSCICGRLAQTALNDLNHDHATATYRLVAVRLPYDIQADEDDAQTSLTFIQPALVLDLNVKPGADAIHNTVVDTLSRIDELVADEKKLDFAKGNVKARTRMVLQYDVAGILGGLVIGTDHSAENVTGFYTKYGDGAVDLVPLFGLNKRQLFQIAGFLGAPQKLITKMPTADLETLNPGLEDEVALGLTYDQIDDFLEGKPVSLEVERKIIDIFVKTAHKRDPIPSIYDVSPD